MGHSSLCWVKMKDRFLWDSPRTGDPLRGLWRTFRWGKIPLWVRKGTEKILSISDAGAWGKKATKELFNRDEKFGRAPFNRKGKTRGGKETQTQQNLGGRGEKVRGKGFREKTSAYFNYLKRRQGGENGVALFGGNGNVCRSRRSQGKKRRVRREITSIQKKEGSTGGRTIISTNLPLKKQKPLGKEIVGAKMILSQQEGKKKPR